MKKLQGTTTWSRSNLMGWAVGKTNILLITYFLALKIHWLCKNPGSSWKQLWFSFILASFLPEQKAMMSSFLCFFYHLSKFVCAWMSVIQVGCLLLLSLLLPLESTSEVRASLTWRFGRVTWNAPSKRQRPLVCPMNSGKPSMKLMRWDLTYIDGTQIFQKGNMWDFYRYIKKSQEC